MSNDIIISLLKNIIDKLEQGELDDSEMMIINEILHKFYFMKDREEHTENDLLKYLSLGYFIYSNLEKKQDL